MSSDWFRLPKRESEGFDDEGPDTFGLEIEKISGVPTHPNGPPIYVCRVEADEEVLTELESKPRVVRLDNIPQQALNSMLGKGFTKNQWDEKFKGKS